LILHALESRLSNVATYGGECRSCYNAEAPAVLMRLRKIAGARKRLLIVDDELIVLRALATALRLQYDVRTCSCPVEAPRCITVGESFHIILSDVMMPGIDGVVFARRVVAQARPDLAGRIVLMTGGLVTPVVRAAFEQSGLPVIAKPVSSLACPSTPSVVQRSTSVGLTGIRAGAFAVRGKARAVG
jgi:CheY-like chemotaxis protein